MNLRLSDAKRAINYSDKWTKEGFNNNNEVQDNTRTSMLSLNKEENPSDLWSLLFGRKNALIQVTSKTTVDPSSVTYKGRKRRTTKYPKKGYCKNPPKKHET